MNIQMLLRLLEAMQQSAAPSAKRAMGMEASVDLMGGDLRKQSGLLELLPLLMAAPGLFGGMMGAAPMQAGLPMHQALPAGNQVKTF